MFDCGLHYRDPAQAETGSFDRHRSRPLEPSSPLRDPEVRVISYFVAPQRGRPDPGEVGRWAKWRSSQRYRLSGCCAARILARRTCGAGRVA